MDIVYVVGSERERVFSKVVGDGHELISRGVRDICELGDEELSF